jgi:hypothetical protein
MIDRIDQKLKHGPLDVTSLLTDETLQNAALFKIMVNSTLVDISCKHLEHAIPPISYVYNLKSGIGECDANCDGYYSVNIDNICPDGFFITIDKCFNSPLSINKCPGNEDKLCNFDQEYNLICVNMYTAQDVN